ncbi:hypothetical protein BJX70DRAFT_396682 [Aspergillus crustosus]
MGAINIIPCGDATSFPSVIAYGPDQTACQGDDANSAGRGYTWTKILIDRRFQHGGFTDGLLQSLVENNFLTVGTIEDCRRIIEAFLRALYPHITSTLMNTYGSCLPTTVDYWFTIPAGWSASAKALMRQAIVRAGYGRGDGTRIFFVSEALAAAYCVAKRIQVDKESQSTHFLVADCGGATTDVTTLSDHNNGFRWVYNELGVATGMAASIPVKVKLVMLILHDAAGVASLMQAVEALKFNFSGEEERILELNTGLVTLESEAMQHAFDPVVNEIVKLILDSVTAPRERAKSSVVPAVYLAGGLGKSQYLRQKLIAALAETKIKVLPASSSPHHVASGAALYAISKLQLDRASVDSHYGLVSWYLPRDDASSLATSISHQQRPITWLVRKARALSPKHLLFKEHRQPPVAQIIICHRDGDSTTKVVRIIADASDSPPTSILDHSVRAAGVVVCTLDKVDLAGAKRRELHGQRYYFLVVTVHWRVAILDHGLKILVMELRTATRVIGSGEVKITA